MGYSGAPLSAGTGCILFPSNKNNGTIVLTSLVPRPYRRGGRQGRIGSSVQHTGSRPRKALLPRRLRENRNASQAGADQPGFRQNNFVKNPLNNPVIICNPLIFYTFARKYAYDQAKKFLIKKVQALIFHVHCRSGARVIPARRFRPDCHPRP